MSVKRDWPANQAELADQLIKRRDRYERLVYSMSDLLMLLEADGTVVFSNRTARPGSGLGRYPGIGQNALAGVVEQDRPAVAEALRDVISGGAPGRRVLFRTRGPDGSERDIEGILTPVVEGGQVVQAEFLGRDVTERHRTLQALQRRQADLARELGVAAKIQASLLPAPLEADRILIDLKHVPLMSVGGDYAHIDRRDPLRPVVAVFDVAGHGIASALVANRVHSAIYALLGRGAGPPDMIRQLNRFVYRSFSDLGLFVTLFVMQLDLGEGRACYCGAGHPPALVRRPGGQVVQLESRHLPIGVEEEVFLGPPEAATEIAPGDLIWIYTDGLMELPCPDGRMIGVAGLSESLRALGPVEAHLGLAEKCLESVLAGSASPNDDITLVVAAIR